MKSPNRLTIIYSFKIVDGKEPEFIDCWTELTKLIYEYEGSYGSKLFKIDDTLFIATAEWPNQDVFSRSGNKLPETAASLRSEMRQCCSEIKQEFELKTVVIDLLKDEQHKNFKM